MLYDREEPERRVVFNGGIELMVLLHGLKQLDGLSEEAVQDLAVSGVFPFRPDEIRGLTEAFLSGYSAPIDEIESGNLTAYEAAPRVEDEKGFLPFVIEYTAGYSHDPLVAHLAETMIREYDTSLYSSDLP